MLSIASDVIGIGLVLDAIIEHSKDSNLMEKLDYLSKRQDSLVVIYGYRARDNEFSLAWYKDEDAFIEKKAFMFGGLVKHSDGKWSVHT